MDQQNIIYTSPNSFAESDLSHQTHFDLRFYQWDNYREPQFISLLCTSLRKCEKIQSLDLDLEKFPFKVKQFVALCEVLSVLKTLQSIKLNFGYCKFQDVEELITLGAAFKKLTNLTCLKFHFQQCEINDTLTISIVNGLGHLEKLKYLEVGLWMNQIAQEGATDLGIQLSCLKNLTNLILYLGGNQIKDQGAVAISKGISELKNLTDLILMLWTNGIGNDGASALGKALNNFKNLKCLELNLEDNLIGDEGGNNILDVLSTCQNLSSLSFSLKQNETSDQFNLNVSKCICSINKLLSLEIRITENCNYFKFKGLLNCNHLQNLKIEIEETSYEFEQIVKKAALKLKRLIYLEIVNLQFMEGG
ncbi:hypothetical protein TTHERM_01421350 (macronuclear) [Tetrahymena thermophila SB210]|uniref:Kinase domain protein n=1 Tax=Tetrahymena thermophila (strain SB210) TaxID=312017 RepID=Q23P35_TETTS|nr:hypothetical protein TTHERM_01421350 [Tetrahymena thermophila SB210]EAR98291.2 hypothetical protein TTHERM_01421350 [Tetrahymena thermophila SB210]|eukprot:XP_001018536.2 hypothetical protein TTHERM_01421350 [Tetrahymena thermophila SB210]